MTDKQLIDKIEGRCILAGINHCRMAENSIVLQGESDRHFKLKLENNGKIYESREFNAIGKLNPIDEVSEPIYYGRPYNDEGMTLRDLRDLKTTDIKKVNGSHGVMYGWDETLMNSLGKKYELFDSRITTYRVVSGYELIYIGQQYFILNKRLGSTGYYLLDLSPNKELHLKSYYRAGVFEPNISPYEVEIYYEIYKTEAEKRGMRVPGLTNIKNVVALTNRSLGEDIDTAILLISDSPREIFEPIATKA